jgi:hypothetical protein
MVPGRCTARRASQGLREAARRPKKRRSLDCGYRPRGGAGGAAAVPAGEAAPEGEAGRRHRCLMVIRV